MILIIDNYDSFTYNLAQCIGELGWAVRVVRNDEISVPQVKTLSPRAIVISPGPGLPTESGISLQLIKIFGSHVPILGVCLGHQGIASVFGSRIMHAPIPMHGKTSLVYHDGKGLFHNVSNPFIAARYHSLIVDHSKMPYDLMVTAWTDNGFVMACRHRRYSCLQGIQFHPESLWTSEGKQIIYNFLKSVA
uniref:Anthranilate synthase component 2 n=1 Tax=Scinaia undulata TaxID=1884664 RepID=A0A1G4NX77_9FLOR|nr:Anthranilate synthase component II [Scinaia undulata]SCW23293.1 Anthranilate synthase component II [Scinaia undulata]